MELAWSQPLLQEGGERALPTRTSSPIWDVRNLLCSGVFLTL